MSRARYDLCVIGGGINGAGIARDAAGRGMSVLLLEAGDLASATSSASTKLIHGGLRYLEYYEFNLVRDSLKEREVLLRQAPHIIRPLEFVLPHDAGQRPVWMIRAGLFLYDHLAGRKKLAGSRAVNLQKHAAGMPLKQQYKRGFIYSDCWADDARLVVLNAIDAAEHGAVIRTGTACVQFRQDGKNWVVTMRDLASGQDSEIECAMLINAAGPWAHKVLENSGMAGADVPKIRLVKGSHIIIRRRHEGDQAYILQQPGKRIVFVIPYERDYTLIGTTEEEYEGDPSLAEISDKEIAYLCEAFNYSFRAQITKSDVIWTYSGVRPLLEDGENSATAVTRDYRLHKHREFDAPMISVFGGKLTTYRVLAEKAVNMLTMAPAWTAGAALPGGDMPGGDFDKFLQAQILKYGFLPADLVLRYARSYGTRMDRFLGHAKRLSDLGQDLGDRLYMVEADYLVRQEWARSAADILWRRSKLGLHVRPETARKLERVLPEIISEGRAA